MVFDAACLLTAELGDHFGGKKKACVCVGLPWSCLIISAPTGGCPGPLGSGVRDRLRDLDVERVQDGPFPNCSTSLRYCFGELERHSKLGARHWTSTECRRAVSMPIGDGTRGQD